MTTDIIYQDKNVAILDPRAKRGILVFHMGAPRDNFCETPLKSGQQLYKEGIEFGRSMRHPYIFFRAPFYPNPINYDSVGSEIMSSYDDFNLANTVWIRVDPNLTYVYSSEMRVNLPNEPKQLDQTRRSMCQYLEIIKQNQRVEGYARKGHQPVVYDLFDGRAYIGSSSQWYYTTAPSNRNSEILVSLPEIPVNYYVACFGGDIMIKKFNKVEDSHVIYQDKNVAILDPRVKRGVLVFHRGDPHDDFCETPLTLDQQLHQERTKFGATLHLDLFFRAPFYNNPINYDSIGSEIISSYGDLDLANTVWIRVDPDLTYVYSSNMLIEYPHENAIKITRKSLRKYLEIIQQNQLIETEARRNDQPLMYNLVTSRVQINPASSRRDDISSRDTSQGPMTPRRQPLRAPVSYPFSKVPINRSSEILVSLPEIPVNYYVACFGGVI